MTSHHHQLPFFSKLISESLCIVECTITNKYVGSKKILQKMKKDTEWLV
jgi:hypothetical protein